MENINTADKYLSQSKLNDNIKVWKKPVLLQLTIKQTLEGESGCPTGYTFVDGVCKPPQQ